MYPHNEQVSNMLALHQVIQFVPLHVNSMCGSITDSIRMFRMSCYHRQHQNVLHVMSSQTASKCTVTVNWEQQGLTQLITCVSHIHYIITSARFRLHKNSFALVLACTIIIILVSFWQATLWPFRSCSFAKKESTIQNGYRTWGTHARMFSQTLAHGSSKNEIRYRNRRRR